VPYRRFSAEVIAAGIEAYASKEIAYRDLSTDLSEMELAEPEMDVRAEELCGKLLEVSPPKKADDVDEPPCRPSYTTVFGWVDFACKRTESLLLQLQKELVQERKRGKEITKLPAEGLVENPNGYKSTSDEKERMLDRLSFATCPVSRLLIQSKKQWYGLRAYFLTKAESRKDVLTDTRVQLPITQTFELAIS
jgi:hypothetical protein